MKLREYFIEPILKAKKDYKFYIRLLLGLLALPFAHFAWIATTCMGLGLIIILGTPIFLVGGFLMSDKEMMNEGREGALASLMMLAMPYVYIFQFIFYPQGYK